MSSLKDDLRLFRTQATDLINTINRISNTLAIDSHSCHRKRVLIIQKIVCDHYELPHSAMGTRARTNRVVIPRHLALYLSRELTKHSLEDIGRCFRHDMDHGTVIHACNATQERIDTDTAFRDTVATLRARCVEAIEREAMPLFAINPSD